MIVVLNYRGKATQGYPLAPVVCWGAGGESEVQDLMQLERVRAPTRPRESEQARASSLYIVESQKRLAASSEMTFTASPVGTNATFSAAYVQKRRQRYNSQLPTQQVRINLKRLTL